MYTNILLYLMIYNHSNYIIYDQIKILFLKWPIFSYYYYKLLLNY